MAKPSEDRISVSPQTALSLLTRLILALILVAGILLISPLWEKNLVFGQDGGIIIRVASGYPTELPADDKSETVLELDLSNCSFGGVSISPDGSFWIETSTTSGSISSITAVNDPITLKSGFVPGDVFVTAKVSYCPPGGVMLFGVCSDPSSDKAQCTGVTTFTFYEPGLVEEEEDQDQPSAGVPPADPPQGADESSSPPDEPDSISGQASLAEIYDDLEEFLAGEGIEAPTPGQIGTSGTAIVTLLVGWLVLNRRAGIDAEKSLEVIQAWRDGERPPTEPEAKLPSDFGEGDIGTEDEVPDKPSEPADPDETLVTKPSPVQEGGEDRLLRSIKDAQDYDDALKNFNKDLEALEGKIPDQVKNSEAWKKHIAPKWNKPKDLAKKGELDKARTWLDRAEEIIKVPEEAARDLDHVPSDQRKGLVRLVQALKAGGYILSDTYDVMVSEPIKATVSKILPPEKAQAVNKKLDEQSQALSDVGQGVPAAVQKHARNLIHGDMQDNLEIKPRTDSAEIVPDSNEDILDTVNFGERKVPVKNTDFIGKGTGKVKELWNRAMKCLGFQDS